MGRRGSQPAASPSRHKKGVGLSWTKKGGLEPGQEQGVWRNGQNPGVMWLHHLAGDQASCCVGLPGTERGEVGLAGQRHNRVRAAGLQGSSQVVSRSTGFGKGLKRTDRGIPRPPLDLDTD